MFSYYGSKSKVVDLYPKPLYDKIIEPFAGSARYALKYFDRDVLLVDKYPVIVKIWEYLKQASESDIMNLPEPEYHKSLDDYSLAEGERLLLGFLANRGNASPCKLVNNYSNIAADKKRIASNLFKIRHWNIILGTYEDIENQKATWFIDPPYFVGGHKYKKNQVDYVLLAEWCKLRDGQAIVCENTKASWLPFIPMKEMTGAYTKTTEAIWSNVKTNFSVQETLL